jgi:hypothetical protein
LGSFSCASATVRKSAAPMANTDQETLIFRISKENKSSEQIHFIIRHA